MSLKTIRKLFTCLIIAVAALLAMPSLHANDQVQYGQYLGVRLRMYDESYRVLDKIISSGSATEKSRAKQAKATVIKAEADFDFTSDGDEGKRTDKYLEAIKVFGEMTDKAVIAANPKAVASKGTMMVEVARSLVRSDPEEARKIVADAMVMLKIAIDDLEAKRDAGDKDFKNNYESFSEIYYRFCESFFVRGMSYPKGTAGREEGLAKCEEWFGEFDFSVTDGVTLENVKSYTIYAEIAQARGDLLGAVSKYIDLVNYVAQFGVNSDVGMLALTLGYLRATPILVEDLGYEPENLKKVIKYYADAKAKYGQFKGLDYFFKRFELFQIAAMVKLGDESKLEGAITKLFKLAKDDDPLFRRRALSVLADIASSDKLERGLRFKCVSLAYAGNKTNPWDVNFRVANAFQSILAGLDNVDDFETYGPACYVAIAEIYANIHRFYDVAMLSKEASLRTRYFREKYANLKEGGDVPAHMKDKTDAIKTGKEVYDFTSLMADEYAKNAKLCANPKWGDPDNPYYVKLAKEAEVFKAKVGGETALMDLVYGRAFEHQKGKRYAQAAVLYLNLPAEYRKYYLAVYSAGNSYYSLSAKDNVRAMSTKGEDDEQESSEFYEAQKNRLAPDLAGVQPSLLAGLNEDHWPEIYRRDIDGKFSNWHKCLYYLKKYILIDAQREWENIKAGIEANPEADYIDAIIALAKYRNAKWERKNPSGKGEPDIEMSRLGRAVFKLAYLMRYPPKSISKDEKAAALAKFRGQALRIVIPFWSLFGVHFEGDDKYKKGSLKMSFYALIESGDLAGAEDVYKIFKEAYPKEEKEIRVMVVKLYNLIGRTGLPNERALIRAAGGLRARASNMKKDMFLRISGEQVAWKKKLDEAKGSAATHDVLADYFWQVWVKGAIFGETDKPTEKSKARLEEAAKYYPEFLPELTKWWEQKATEYKKRWADNVRKSYSDTVKLAGYAGIKSKMDSAVKGKDNAKVLDILQTEINKLKGSDLNKGQNLLAIIKTATEQDRYFVGTIFIYELAEYFEARAIELEEDARPITTRYLMYYQLWRTMKGGSSKLSKKDLKNMALQYFRIRDWDNTIKYWQEYVDQFAKRWGKVESIKVSMKTNPKVAGQDSSNEELEVRYQLGRAYLERYKTGNDIKDLKKATLLLRRCHNYNLIRDAIEIVKLKVTMRFKKSIEKYYLGINNGMAECYLLLHKADVNMNWPKYKNQYNKDLKADALQYSANNKAEFLYAAILIHKFAWQGFKGKSAYQYRTEFRMNFVAWANFMAVWKETYGLKDAGVKQVKKQGVKEWLEDAQNNIVSEQQFDSTTLNESTKAFIASVKSCEDRLKKIK
ncbi:MAG: hypothetical protein L3J82_02115 [Planctomycetes bacterium]|nr:hypothetical protein [Planctomycetota bacterium]